MKSSTSDDKMAPRKQKQQQQQHSRHNSFSPYYPTPDIQYYSPPYQLYSPYPHNPYYYSPTPALIASNPHFCYVYGASGFQHYPFRPPPPPPPPPLAQNPFSLGYNTAPNRPASGTGARSNLDLPRGPPKKPRQSGHAIWVGNLPLYTTLDELCKRFGTMDIQSIFLIERTNCAFVNYKSADAVRKGVEKFHTVSGSYLRGNKLLIKQQVPKDDPNQHQKPKQQQPTSEPSPSSENRYFICKSLTIEDLQASAKLGIWSTQTHNEDLFNHAFRTSANVYLFFSANRTGEYYGYARMESEIKSVADDNNSSTHSGNNNDDDNKEDEPTSKDIKPTMSPSPSSHGSSRVSSPSSSVYYPTTSTQLPKIITTPADESIPIPPGRIVDDSSRGSLFWEVLTEDSESDDSTPDEPSSTPKSANNWTSPFKIKWLSEKPLPFSKTNNLRNPYNDNKPVKIARDGTEVEPSVGEKLLELFNSQ